MKIHFLLPDIQGIPTGGNVYNERMMEALGAWAEVSWSVWPAWDLCSQADVVIVDSLIAPQVADEVMHEVSNKWLLLAHYFPFCNPDEEEAGGEDLRVDFLAAYDGCITTSRYMQQCMIQQGMAKDQVFAVYPGLDEVWFGGGEARPARESGVVRMLTVASLLPGKGLLEFVDVLEGLNKSNWRWTVVGDDSLDADYARRFKKRIAESSYRHHINWKGTIAPEEMPAVYPEYDMFVLPSRFESLGMCLREALVSGVPVLAYDVGGVKENLQWGGGLLAPAYDAAIFGQLLEKYIEDAEFRGHMGAIAGKAGAMFSTWQTAASELYQVLTLLHEG